MLILFGTVASKGECPCDTLTDCTSCSSNPNCGWCCDGNCLNGTSVGPSDSASCPSWIYHSCTGSCTPACVNGDCVCGQCVCPLGFGGTDCSSPVGCDGIVNSGRKVGILKCNMVCDSHKYLWGVRWKWYFLSWM